MARRLHLEGSPRLVVYASCLLIALALRTWTWWADQGVYWPDEIYQSMEPAHRMAFGYGILPWEFQMPGATTNPSLPGGARSWLFPGVLGIVLRCGAAAGIRTGVGMVLLAKGVMVLSGVAGVYAGMRIAERLVGLRGALWSGMLLALFPASIVFGSRCMSEAASGSLVIWALLFALERGSRSSVLAALFAVLAIFVRYQLGLIGIGIFAMFLFSRRWRDAATFGAASIVVGALGGALDWVTWGSPFHAFRTYVKFNFIEGRASDWGTAESDYYTSTLSSSTGVTIWIVALGFLCALRWIRTVPIFVALFLCAHAFIPHKEYRFLLPVVPLALALAGAGLAGGLTALLTRVPARWRNLPSDALVATVAALLVHRLSHMTLSDMGFFGSQAPADRPSYKDDPPWNINAGPNYGLWEAGKHDDLCGVSVSGVPLIAHGAYTYLHRKVPIVEGFRPHETNYFVAPRLTPPPAGWSVVASFKAGYPGDFVLFRREGGCAPGHVRQEL